MTENGTNFTKLTLLLSTIVEVK